MIEPRKGLEFPVCELPVQPYIVGDIDAQLFAVQPGLAAEHEAEFVLREMRAWMEALILAKKQAGLKGGGYKFAIWSTGAK